jgi:pSer/pThr/pTyr-binding forkhead associated (FHA) protein
MPVITVDNKQFSLRPGQNRLGAGDDVDVPVDGNSGNGVHAIVELVDNDQVVIRRTNNDSTVRVNGIPLIDPTPLIHGDKVEIAGKELLFADDSKSGDTTFVSAADIAAILASKRSGPARATAATGGRLVSLVDGKEYSIPHEGVLIGRDASAGVVVAQNEVSRRHAEVTPVEGGYELRDFSANGVFVNGARLERPQILSRADVIRVGSEEFRFYADVQASPATPAPSAVVPPPPVVPRVASLANTVSFSALRSAIPTPPADASPVAAVAPRPILASLEITNAGPTKGQQFEVHVPLAHVGRGVHNEIVLTDDSVSETHAKLQRRDDGWYVVDLGSTNGTYVGGQRLNAERRLDGAPDVRFGGVKMIFRSRDTASGGLADTRAIAVGRSQPNAAPSADRVPGPIDANASLGPPSGPLVPVWVWVVLVLAVGAAVAFSLLNR